MESQKEIPDFDLNSPDLEIFSDLISKNKKKVPLKQKLLSNPYIRTGFTLALLLFLFGSTFFIASRVKKPTYTTSSANVGYIPEAQIEIPQIKKVKACSETNEQSETPAFINSYCRGKFCNNYQVKEDCESVDVLTVENGFLSEETGQDGIGDCLWTEEATCKPKY